MYTHDNDVKKKKKKHTQRKEMEENPSFRSTHSCHVFLSIPQCFGIGPKGKNTETIYQTVSRNIITFCFHFRILFSQI